LVLAEWKKLRRYYAEAEHHAPSNPGDDPVRHTRQISVFVRDPHSLTEERFNELVEKLKKMVPGARLWMSHGRVNQDKKVCPEGDWFEHHAAKSHAQADEEIEE